MIAPNAPLTEQVADVAPTALIVALPAGVELLVPEEEDPQDARAANPMMRSRFFMASLYTCDGGKIATFG